MTKHFHSHSPFNKGWMKGDFLVIPYRKDLKPISRTLRTHMTDSEQALWARLRRKQLRGIQFYRQKPVGEFIVDFFAPKAKLVIEIDGSQHLTPMSVRRDEKRSAALQRQGLRILRFTNLQVLQELDQLLRLFIRH